MLSVTAKRLHVHPTLPPAQLLLSITASATAAGTGSLGDTELSVCCRGLRTLVSNSKHIICGIIESQNWERLEKTTWMKTKQIEPMSPQTNTPPFNKPESSVTEA